MELEKAVYKKRLWELAQHGKTAAEIMRELNISDLSVLKNDLQDLMQKEGKTINVPGLIGKPTIEGRYTDNGEPIPPDMQSIEGVKNRKAPPE